MAETIKQTEAIPSSYPAVPSGLSTAAAALDSAMIWQRIESYTAFRWADRQVVWTVEGEGDWCPPLTPATVTAVEVWEALAWTATTPPASPYGGYDFPGEGPYRVTADVGDGTAPAAVNEAFRRLAEYMAEGEKHPGASSFSTSIGGAIDISETRNAAWMARALQNSGAADLLRPYRRA